MLIRPYQPEDDPALMALERKSARGFPKPFVHFRRKFIDRANLYRQSLTLVAIDDNAIVGVSSVCIKNTLVGNHAVKVGYSFDTRVSPDYRRKGVGHAMVEEKLKWAEQVGAVGVYSLVVSTNNASLGMVQKSGYEKIRMVLYLQYQPYPIILPPNHEPECHHTPPDLDAIESIHRDRDLYVKNIHEQVQHLDFERWTITADDGRHAGLSLYNQAKVYCKIPVDEPWPQTEADIERLGRNIQLFDVVGLEHTDLIYDIFQRVRDEAVVTNVNKLVWLVDRNEIIPEFMFSDASQQTDYWLMYKTFDHNLHLNWQDNVYLDPRDL